MNQTNNWLTISELAHICGISRQTLIYYDKHNIFKPGYIDDKGYHYYSLYQLPFLREICSLKGDNVSLKEIIDNLHNRNLNTTIELLLSNRQNMEKELGELQQRLNVLNARLDYYEVVKEVKKRPALPYITQCPERKIMFLPWDTTNMNRREMHLTHMKLRRECISHNIPLAWGWGALFPKESVINRDYLNGAGGYMLLPAFTPVSQNTVCLMKWSIWRSCKTGLNKTTIPLSEMPWMSVCWTQPSIPKKTNGTFVRSLYLLCSREPIPNNLHSVDWALDI